MTANETAGAFLTKQDLRLSSVRQWIGKKLFRFIVPHFSVILSLFLSFILYCFSFLPSFALYLFIFILLVLRFQSLDWHSFFTFFFTFFLLFSKTKFFCLFATKSHNLKLMVSNEVAKPFHVKTLYQQQYYS